VPSVIAHATATLKPGILGGDADPVTWGYLTKREYPEYSHVPGPPDGSLSSQRRGSPVPKLERYSSLPELPVEQGGGVHHGVPGAGGIGGPPDDPGARGSPLG